MLVKYSFHLHHRLQLPHSCYCLYAAVLQGFADGALANVMWALAKVGLQPGAAFREALWEDLHTR